MGQLRLLGEPPTSDDHAALANLAFAGAGHTGFVAAAGLAGGQTIIGGSAPGENLSLQSSAHAARGVVQVIDALRLVSGLIQDPAGTPRLSLGTASPHLTLTGDMRVTGYAALAGATPGADAYLKVNPSGVTWTSGANIIQMNPTSCSVGVGGSLAALGANATASILAGATPTIRGLNFVGFVSGPGSPLEVSGIVTQAGCIGFSGAIADLHSLYAYPAYVMLQGGSITRTHGLRIGNQGKAGVVTTYGLLIEPQTNSASCYSIWAGATRTGTPRLRLDEGTPAANQTLLWLAEGTTPTLRQVQWKQSQLLAPLDKVMILV